MNSSPHQPHRAVVVGLDHTSSSQRAIGEGIKQARILGRPLHLVHATGVGLIPWTAEYLGEKSQRLWDYRRHAARQAQDLDITCALHVEDPAGLLVKASETAELLVLGSSGLARSTDVLRGATTHRVVAHAHCPVMVIPLAARQDDTGAIVVGVDAADHSLPALEWAFAEASRCGTTLVAVHTWWWESLNADLAGTAWEGRVDEVESSERLVLAEMLAGWHERYPDVPVQTSLVRGQATVVLEDLSASSRLVVVGTRGRGGFAGLLLGSVSAYLVHRAHCPVVVVPSMKTS